MRRAHLFEFCDQTWLPATFRALFVESLDDIHRVTKSYKTVDDALAKIATELTAAQVLDLCSGGGGHLDVIFEEAKGRNLTLPKIVASDLFPQIESWQDLQKKWGENRLDFIANPVSATDKLPEGTKVCSLFSAFHHFRPETARQILSSTLSQTDALVIGEVTSRRAFEFFLMILSFPAMLFFPIFVGKFSWRRLLWCTLLPIVTFIVIFDGAVSVLRTYSPDEICEMIPYELKQKYECRVSILTRRFGFSSWTITLVRKESQR